jgi:stage V sporulation protein R
MPKARKKKGSYNLSQDDWTVEYLDEAWKAMDKAATKYGWKGYAPLFEIVTDQQMLDCYTTHGLPSMFDHWSFGEQSLKQDKQYRQGKVGLALEMIINSNPSVCYLLEHNNACAQLLVIAHAAVGHSHFFKNNYLLRENGNADGILSYLRYAKNYIAECENKYGVEIVDHIVTACLSLQANSIELYKNKHHKSAAVRKKEAIEKERHIREHSNALSDRFAEKTEESTLAYYLHHMHGIQDSSISRESDLSLLHYIERHSPLLADWQKEIVRICRNIFAHTAPQYQTKMLNEGFATFVEYHLMNDLYDDKLISDGMYLEFLHSHTDLTRQSQVHVKRRMYNGEITIQDNQFYSGINPYAFGFHFFMDVKRICQEPTEEDKRHFPGIAGSDWITTINDLVKNYTDSTAIQQFLSPKLIRDFHFSAIELTKKTKGDLLVSSTHSDEDYETIRNLLSKQYDNIANIPQIEVWYHDKYASDTLYLGVEKRNGNGLEKDMAPGFYTLSQDEQALTHIAVLWGGPLFLDEYEPWVTSKNRLSYKQTYSTRMNGLPKEAKAHIQGNTNITYGEK